ncbi:MAG: hypothetical protein C0483_08370 [Pirellula sp.]|nr:hypothetical protein [Pirellula sp.]
MIAVVRCAAVFVVALCLECECATALAQAARNKVVKPFGFDTSREGEYTSGALRADWPSVEFGEPKGRAFIVRDDRTHGRVLRVSYPQGSVGPGEGGMQFLVKLPPADEYWLSYLVKFEEGFDFRKGGKLPGLTSGGSRFTGGKKPENGEGWSARYMWREAGVPEIYLYYVDMPGEWGQGIVFKDVKFEPGRWHRLIQHIRVNRPDKADGLLEAWFDDKQVLSRNDLRLRIGNQGQIDSFYFSTFHGGQGDEWAPSVDSFARYDDFLLDVKRPAFIKP